MERSLVHRGPTSIGSFIGMRGRPATATLQVFVSRIRGMTGRAIVAASA